MADPAELIERFDRAIRAAERSPIPSFAIASEASAARKALLAALTPPPSAEDAAVLDAYMDACKCDAPKCVGIADASRAAVLSRMAGKVPTWRKIDDDTPERCIVAAWNDRQKVWAVGEAYRHEDGAWWWANESSGDYHAEAININPGPPELWQPLPAAPEAPRK